MTHCKAYDTLIVGQGLAGSLLAWSLLQQGMKVAIVSDGELSASQVAAGIINPVTGQRFVLADDTPNMLHWATTYYQQLAAQLAIDCYHPTPMLRLFQQEKEQAHWQKRRKNDRYHDFLAQNTLPASRIPHLYAPLSGILQQQTAWLNTNMLLDALLAYFQQLGIHQQAAFAYDALEIHDAHIQYQGIHAKHIIFCQGYKVQHNPYFSYLPLQPAHGEIISCSSASPLTTDIINHGKWLLPTSTHHCKIGATYAHSSQHPELCKPTVQAASRNMLLNFANRLFKQDMGFKVTQHQAGIRPATLDKQPFLGFHPQHAPLGVFNGFGSRGSLLIPWYARILSLHILQQQPIPDHANIQRYHHLCA